MTLDWHKGDYVRIRRPLSHRFVGCIGRILDVRQDFPHGQGTIGVQVLFGGAGSDVYYYPDYPRDYDWFTPAEIDPAKDPAEIAAAKLVYGI